MILIGLLKKKTRVSKDNTMKISWLFVLCFFFISTQAKWITTVQYSDLSCKNSFPFSEEERGYYTKSNTCHQESSVSGYQKFSCNSTHTIQKISFNKLFYKRIVRESLLEKQKFQLMNATC